jgi:hypothetical protein
MATDIVGSLFGVNPQAYQQARDKLAYSQDYQAVQLDPLQQANLALRQGGRGLGQLAGGLMGMQDPELAKASQIKQIAGQLDLNSSEGLRQLANSIKEFAPQEAMMAAKRADEVALNQATITQKTREKAIPTSGLGKLLFEKDELLKAGVPSNDPRVVAYDQAIAAEGKGKGTSITVDQRGQTAFAVGLGTADATRVNTAEKLIESGIGTLNTLKQMADKNTLGVVSGTGAGARVEALRFLDTIGVATPGEKNKLANSENFNKLTGDLVLERIKMLGTNPSNADRDFIKAIVPQLENSAAARKQLIEYMTKRATQVINEASALSDYGRKNQGLTGYKPTIPLIDVSKPSRDISSYSVEELEAMKKTAKPSGAK